jgi:hypothetical protein
MNLSYTKLLGILFNVFTALGPENYACVHTVTQKCGARL